MRQEAIDALLAELRARHVELQRPLTWHGIRRVFAREDIELVIRPLHGRAQCISQGGISIVMLSSADTGRQHTRWAAHEYAHLKLHFEEAGAGEIVRHVSPIQPDDPREREAYYLASCLLQGPGVTVDWPEVPTWRPPVEPEQLQLAPEVLGPPAVPRPWRLIPRSPAAVGVPVRALPSAASRAARRRPASLARQAAARQLPPEAQDQVTAALERARRVGARTIRRAMVNPNEPPADLLPRIERAPGGRVYYQHLDGTRWRIHTVRFAGGRFRRVSLEAREATGRVFVPEGEGQARKHYSFRLGERIEVELAHLERQFREAEYLPTEPYDPGERKPW
jgi:hypothetical protein